MVQHAPNCTDGPNAVAAPPVQHRRGSPLPKFAFSLWEQQATSTPAHAFSARGKQNGSLRQWCKRLTRLTYAFSKKWENLRAALALHFAYYNFCRVHSTIKATPAMAAGLAAARLTLAELLA